jgi:RNA 3'-terminal phosphate cyclase (ATP)
MINIDGAYGEGGGQILRTALTLASLAVSPITVEKIRRGRPKPGLQPQHLTGVRAVAQICQGKLKGDELFSDNLTLEPGVILPGSYEFDVAKYSPSAGSVGMILQQLLPILIYGKENSYITIKGGTDVAWAPPIEFIQRVFLPTLARMGVTVELEIYEWGFFPIGGGSLKATVHPLAQPLKALQITERGNLKNLYGWAAAANLPQSILDREIKQAQKMLEEIQLGGLAKIESQITPSKSTGNIFFLCAEYENCWDGFSVLGELGKPAEKVVAETMEQFKQFHQGTSAVEKHLADQLLVYLALAQGKSRINVQEITPHLQTNIWMIEQLLPVKFEISGNLVAVEGIGKTI